MTPRRLTTAATTALLPALALALALAAAGCGDETGAGDDDSGVTVDGGAAASDGASTGDGATPQGDASTALPGMRIGSFQLTYYWVTTEDEFTGVADTELYDPMCRSLATVPKAFSDSLRIEGTGRLADGRLLNVNGVCMCLNSPCYRVADAAHPWGYGVQNRALVPFRSIAVDRSVIPIGTPLYVAELDGKRMPGDAPWGNFTHDGCVLAVDVGGGITGMHIDFFSALKTYYRVLDPLLPANITVHQGGARCP